VELAMQRFAEQPAQPGRRAPAEAMDQALLRIGIGQLKAACQAAAEGRALD